MEGGILLPVVESLAFVAGAAAIHGLRGHVETVTVCLCLVASLLLCALLVVATPPDAMAVLSTAYADPDAFAFSTF